MRPRENSLTPRLLERQLTPNDARTLVPRLDREPTAAYDVRTVPDVDYPIARAVVYELTASDPVKRL